MEKNELGEKLAQQDFAVEIVEAFSRVDRRRFILKQYDSFAYDDIALPIGYEQTISQPSTIAFMFSLLAIVPEQGESIAKPELKILEVGSGSGYVLALLAEIAGGAAIYGTEKIKELFDISQDRLKNKTKVRLFHTPSGIGLPRRAPFDRILVSASAEVLPVELLAQLAEEGVMVCPVKNSIIKITKRKGEVTEEEFPGFVFVPLLD